MVLGISFIDGENIFMAQRVIEENKNIVILSSDHVETMVILLNEVQDYIIDLQENIAEADPMFEYLEEMQDKLDLTLDILQPGSDSADDSEPQDKQCDNEGKCCLTNIEASAVGCECSPGEKVTKEPLVEIVMEPTICALG